MTKRLQVRRRPGPLARGGFTGLFDAPSRRVALAALAGLAAVCCAGPAAAGPDGSIEPDGKIAAPLASALRSSPGTSRRLVYLLADPAEPAAAIPRSADAALQRSAVRSAMTARRAAAESRLLRTGHEIVYASDYAGVIVAVGNAAAVTAMAGDATIKAVLQERVHRPRLNVSRVVTQASVVQGRGIDGTGAKVGVVEEGSISSHPNLPSGRRTACRPTSRIGASDHKTAVAGIIQSTHATYRGIAPGVTILDGIGVDFSDAEMIAATDCVVSRGAVAVSMSFGSDTDGEFDAFAQYVDRLVYNTGVSVVVAVSNVCSLRMGSPEIAYNDISVGAFSDRGTAGLGDDLHACSPAIAPSFSAYRDPPSRNGDREQPDLVAPGHDIRSTRLKSGFVEGSGTSFAAPHVAAGIGLLQDRASFSLATQAERVRAILMASARRNIEGSATLSDRDGAGAVRFAAADAVLRGGTSWWFQTSGGSAGFPRTQSFQATAGQKVRVALAWAHKPGKGNSTVSTNLDLAVSDPGGTQLAASRSQDNNFEIVSFVASRTGTYRIRIDNRRTSTGAEHVGLAVSRTDS
ncbi:MAG TPA: S8 family serine peptidase [Geminicoccaceae bacterium]|nr:S8 family serine peptidase [Geminicoccus sp.]HMU49487.1 S8 family serine peptidase [Geminicoccaceae bacterium]